MKILRLTSKFFRNLNYLRKDLPNAIVKYFTENLMFFNVDAGCALISHESRIAITG